MVDRVPTRLANDELSACLFEVCTESRDKVAKGDSSEARRLTLAGGFAADNATEPDVGIDETLTTLLEMELTPALAEVCAGSTGSVCIGVSSEIDLTILVESLRTDTAVDGPARKEEIFAGITDAMEIVV